MFSRVSSRRIIIIVTLVLLVYSSLRPARAASDKLSEADAVSLIRSAQIVKEDYPLRAILSGREVVVQTRRAPKASDKDCKIDAVFIAKTLLDAYPKSVSQVKVLFAHEADDKYSEVSVTAVQIANFGAKKITQQQLLESIQLASVDPLETSNSDADPASQLEPGPYRERRLMLLDRIQSLKQKGSGTRPFELIFKQSESLIHAGKTAEADELLNNLADTLKAQELQREHLRNFHPVVVSSKSAPAPAMLSGARPDEKAPGRGDGPPNQTSSRNGNFSVEIHPVHSPRDFEQRMRQIEEHGQSESGSRQPIIHESLERIHRMIDESRLNDAETEARRLEHDLGCSTQYWNKLP